MTFSQAVSVNQSNPECKVYIKRWFILGIFVFYSMTNAFQWIEYSIIANIVQKFYNVPSTYVDWTSMIYMVFYIPFIFPASWLIDKLGLRVAVILGALGTCGGAWVKTFSVAQDRFVVTFIGQSIAALAQIFVLNVPAPLAAKWFGPNEVSSACSIGVLGNQLGTALGFLVPSVLVKNSDDITTIANSLSLLFYSVAITCTISLVIIIFFFQDSPKLPPSPAQAINRNVAPMPFSYSIKNLVTNIKFMMLLISYGINVGIFYAVSTLLNQVLLVHFPGSEADAGWIGLVFTISGMVGSVCCGIILDKTGKFKETAVALYFFSLLGMVAFTLTVRYGHIYIIYVISSFLGFFLTGYLPVGFEFAAELTYPIPESTSSGVLNAGVQVFGIFFTLGAGWVLKDKSDTWSNSSLCCAMAVGFAITTLIGSDLRRQAAQKEAQKPTA